MATANSLPALDDCIRLYVNAHERFDTDPFAADRLDDPADGSDRPLAVRLDLLVAYGLFEPTDDGRYRVRCAPDDPLDRWRDRYADRGEALYRRTTRQSGGADDDPARIVHEGDGYRGVRIADGASLASVASSVAAARSPEAAGVVLRSSAELANRVQRMADDLTDPSTAGGDLPARYEKEGTDLVGSDKNDLEFRLFLREA